ncbi:outer membrane beta-barrel protein [Marinifilum flexuosum]|uniref:outer membrane beta-barrel protein n=1 Tax=Marinifilum flexuosum TaxID=1117708 RepID=UPI00248FF5C0|nr:outer membrane beta-barrel protein [Marinifilum flexuosum]
MKLKLFIFLICFVFGKICLSQNTIKGTITDDKHVPIEGFNATLLNPSDSTLIKGGFFLNGKFELQCKKKEKFLVYLSSLGFQDTILPIEVIDTVKIIPEIHLKKQDIQLDDVTVKARRQLYMQTADKLVMNVEKTVLKEAGDATDVLKKSVKVNVDSENNISVLGKGKAFVYLNGKKISSNEILSLIPSEEIKSVEIIDNPSAQYDSEAMAVVNIITNKNSNLGSAAKVIHTTTKRNSFENSTNLQFSKRSPKNNLYVSYYFLNKKRKYENEYIRDYTQTESPSVLLNEVNEKFSLNPQHSLRINDEIVFNKYNCLNLVLNGSYYKGKYNTDNRNRIFDSSITDEANEEFTSDIDSRIKRTLLNGLINYRIKSENNNHVLDLSVEKYYYDSEKDESILEVLNGKPSKKANEVDNQFNFYTLQTDYKQVFNPSLKLNSGIRYSRYKNESTTNYNSSVSSRNEFFENLEDEFIAHGVLMFSANKWSSKLGVRLEKLKRDTELGNEEIVDRDSWDWLPSFLLSRKLSEKSQLSLSYSKKLVRPSFQDLNPSISYIDSLSYFQGNPNLKNARIHNLNMKFSYMKYASISLFYKKTKNAIVWYIDSSEENDQIAIGTQKNIDLQTTWGMDVVIPYQAKKYTIYLASGFEKINNKGFYADLDKTKWYVKSGIDLSLPYKLNVNLTGLYFSDGVNGIWSYEEAFKIDAGLSRAFLNDKLNVSLAFEDIFKSNEMESNARFNNRFITYKYYYDDSFVRLRVSYKLNKIKKGSRIKSLLKDQENRIKSMYK